MIVDAQVHLWKADSPERPWPRDGRHEPHLSTPLSIDTMIGMMNEAGVDAAVIVPPSWEGERNDYALAAAQAHPNRFAVMGRLNLDDEKLEERLASWRAQKGMLGVRLTFIDDRDRARLAAGGCEAYWSAAEAANVPTMVLAAENLRDIEIAARKRPGLRLIIDHMGLSQKIAREGRIAAAVEATLRFADCPNVAVKVSGLPGYSAYPYPFPDLRDPIRRVLEAFGPRRCFWGADISRLLKTCSYRQTVTHFTDDLDVLDPSWKPWVMGRSLVDFLDWSELRG